MTSPSLAPSYILYIDESGDAGFNSPTDHFILSGLIIPFPQWKPALDGLVNIRREIKQRFGFPARAELKGSALFDPRYAKNRDIYRNIGKRNVRLSLYRIYMQRLADLCQSIGAYTFSVHANKPAILQKHHTQHDVILLAWEKMLNRFDIFLQKQSTPGFGIVVPDATENKKVRQVLRRMRHYHPIASRTSAPYQAKISRIIEDPFFSDSRQSYFIQSADMIAHSVYRFLYRTAYRRYQPWDLYPLLTPCMLKQVTQYDPHNAAIVPIPQP